MSKKKRSPSKARPGKRHYRDKWARAAEKEAKKRKLHGIERKMARRNAPPLSQRVSRSARGLQRGKHARPVPGGRHIWW